MFKNEASFTLEMFNVPRRVVPPIAPNTLMFPPPAARVKAPEPSTVLPKVIFSFTAEVLNCGKVPTKVMGVENEIGPAAVIVDAMEFEPVPDWVNAPPILKMAAAAWVKRPEFAMEKGPPEVVVTVLLNVNALPVRLMPASVFVLIAPLNVVVPVAPS